MANVNRPNGLAPIKGGISPWNGQVNIYWIPSSDTNAYYIGDVVQSEDGSDANGVPKIQKPTGAQTTGNFRGVVVGVGADPNFYGDPNNLNIIYAPATKTQDYYAAIVDDPNAYFEMTDNGAGTPASTWVGKNAGFTVATPTAPVPVSATVITGASVANTNTLPLKIMGLARYPGNTAAAFARWIVKINNHELNNAGTAGNA